MNIRIKRLYICLLLLVFTFSVLLNIYTQDETYKRLIEGSFSAVDKGIQVNENGTIKLNLASLLLPAVGPSSDFSKFPIINEHRHKFIHLPKNICNGSLDLLVAIISSVENFDRRNYTRNSRETLSLGKVAYLFFLGRLPGQSKSQDWVNNEALQFNDIVQEDFTDSERNLTFKSVCILKWVNDFCPRVKYVIKKDDDIKLSIKVAMESLMHKNKIHKHFVMGNSKYIVEGPIRDKLSKYYTSVSEYSGTFFPTFVHGPAYGFPGETALLLYQVSLRTKLFWLEDVYITGICTHRANIPVYFDKGFSYTHESFDAF